MTPGRRGFCYVRVATPDGIFLECYERASGLAVDPIEKKPLYHFYPGTNILSLGTMGCNLDCSFCQNWHMSHPQSASHKSSRSANTNVQDLEHIAIEDLVSIARHRKLPSVAFTYNEPIIFAEFAIDAAHALKDAGIHSVAVTAGYISDEARAAFFSAFDAANVDLKSFDDNFYKKYCKASLKPVLDSLLFVREKTSLWLEITNLIIPGLNDSDDNIKNLSHWIVQYLGVDTPLHFSAFHPCFELQEIPRTPASTLVKARAIAMETGLRYVYIGNCSTQDGSNTRCHQCQQLLIDRKGYTIKSTIAPSGACPSCGYILPGRF